MQVRLGQLAEHVGRLVDPVTLVASFRKGRKRPVTSPSCAGAKNVPMCVGRKQDFWEAHVEAWQVSGQSQSRYYREHQLALASFGYWRRKLKGAAGSAPQGMILIVPTAALAPTSFEIALSNGVTLRVPLSTQPARMLAWVRVLGAY